MPAVRARPAIYGQFSHCEILKWLGEDLHNRGKVLLLNAYADSYRYGAYLGDMVGSEVGAWGNVKLRNLANVELPPDCNLKRTLAYQKPVVNLLSEANMGGKPSPQLTPEQMEQYVKHQLFLGFWPGVDIIGEEKGRVYKKLGSGNATSPIPRCTTETRAFQAIHPCASPYLSCRLGAGHLRGDVRCGRLD